MPVLKGAFLNFGAGILTKAPNIVVFQFNPEQVTRVTTVNETPPTPQGGGRRDARQQPNLPTEKISFTLKIDSGDLAGLSGSLADIPGINATLAAAGILPMLSALELLMVPQGGLLSAASQSAVANVVAYRYRPAKLPTVLFFWGAFRIVPVVFTSMAIQEVQYNTVLNPIRAEVSVDLTILTPSQIASDSTLPRLAYNYTLGVKEAMAAANLANAAGLGVSALRSLLT